MFKGYIELNGKKAITKFKDVPLLTLEEAKECESYGGVLSPNTILIDVDDAKDSDRLYDLVVANNLNCCVMKTTRGKHFYFKNNKVVTKCFTNKQLGIGILADCKVGTTTCYSVLRLNNVDREIIYMNTNVRGEFDDLPCYLEPIEDYFDITGLKKGDGRNSKLYSYILLLQNKFTNDEIKTILPLINRFMFDKSLSKNELDVIMRDEAFQKINTSQFFNDKTFLFNKFAVHLAKQYKLLRINRVLHSYDGSIYRADPRLIERKMIEIIPILNKTKRKEVLDYLELMVNEEYKYFDRDTKYIAFENGLFNIRENQLVEFDPSVVVTNKINWNYNPNAYDETTDKTLDKLACGNPQIRALMEEVAGYCFYRRNELGKAFILIGDKSNGKSTFLDMIGTMLGDDNISALDLRELGERFKTAELLNKMANIGDDIEGEFITNTGVFKKLVTGDSMSAERKGQDPFDFRSYAKLIFSANTIPKMKDKTGAILRRLIIVPFNATFSKDDEDYDPYIKYKLREQSSIEYFIKLAVEGLQRILENNSFTICDDVERELEEYANTIDPIQNWFNEIREDDCQIVIHQSTKSVYNKYTEFCLSNGLVASSNIELSRRICKELDLQIVTRRVDGKRTKLFERKYYDINEV